MSYTTTPLSSFSVPLGIKAHQQAQQSRSHHVDPVKARQVYLNTLTIVAVQDYLAMMGYETEFGDSGDPIQQTLMDCADLDVCGYGRVECRYALPGESRSHVPPEVWGDRLGFIFVRLDESLRHAQILGLASSVHQAQFPLDELLPLEDLSDLLGPQPEVRQANADIIRETVTQLQSWFQNAQDSWQTMQQSLDWFLASPELAYRSPSQTEDLRPELGRSKQLTLTHLDQPLELTIFLGLRSLPTSETEVWVKVSGIRRSLPPELRMSILTPEQTEVMTAQSNGTEAMQFRFSGQVGERFRLQLTLADCRWAEEFVL